MANAVITEEMITKELITQLKNESVFHQKVDRQLDKDNPMQSKKNGEYVEIRRPVMYEAISNNLDVTGATKDAQEASVRVTLDQTRTVPLKFTQKELSLDIEEFSNRHLKPAAIELASQVAVYLGGLYKQVYNFVGTPGTTPSTLANISDAKSQLTRMACPKRGRVAMYETDASSAIANNIPALGSAADMLTTAAIKEASIGRVSGFDIYDEEAIVRHTVGTWQTGSTPLVNNASPAADTYTTGKNTAWTTTVITDGWANSTAVLKEGDVITIAGVNSVNPITRQSHNRLQRFVVRADATSDGSGNATLTISPPLITSGPYKTVDAVYADNAAITVLTGNEGTIHPQNLLFHPKAISLAMAPLMAPDNTLSSTVVEDGIAITFARDGDIRTYESIRRVDILFGGIIQVPQYVCRQTG